MKMNQVAHMIQELVDRKESKKQIIPNQNRLKQFITYVLITASAH